MVAAPCGDSGKIEVAPKVKPIKPDEAPPAVGISIWKVATPNWKLPKTDFQGSVVTSLTLPVTFGGYPDG